MNAAQMSDLLIGLTAAQKLCERLRGVDACKADWPLLQKHVDDLWSVRVKHGGEL